jgi:hypothetical protein
MANCPYCQSRYRDYSIVGVLPASQHLTHWLDPIPLALLGCSDCGRYTLMHPDHPEVQRLSKAVPFETIAENVRTLNVGLEEVGDPELREQFIHGRDDASTQ